MKKDEEKKKKIKEEKIWFKKIKSGDYLLSHLPAKAVWSAPEGLTSVFGMGTGVAPPIGSPETLLQ